jgi:hypothetical protein
MKRRKPRPDLWNTNAADALKFQRTLLERFSEFVQGVGEQAGSGMVDPSGYIQTYADLWRGIIADAGDWSAGPDGEFRATSDWLKLCSFEVSHTATSHAHSFTVPLNSFFSDLQEPIDKLTLVVSDLANRGGGAVLTNKYVRLIPPKITRTHPTSSLKLFDLADRLDAGDVYGGLVWARELIRPVMGISIRVT